MYCKHESSYLNVMVELGSSILFLTTDHKYFGIASLSP